MKKRINSKAKGNSFERKVSKELSLKLTENKEAYSCYRTATSGAISTINKSKIKTSSYINSQIGDICKTEKDGLYKQLDEFFNNYVIECKAYRSLDITPNYCKKFKDILDKLINESNSVNKNFFLILKRNSREVLILTNSELNINKEGSLFYKNILINIYFYKNFIKI